MYKKLRKRAPWITRQLHFFGQFQPRTTERRFVSGETHLYLGRQYKLKVVPHIQQQVKLHRGLLIVHSQNAQAAGLTRTLVDDWYRERAHLKFYDTAPPRVRIHITTPRDAPWKPIGEHLNCMKGS